MSTKNAQNKTMIDKNRTSKGMNKRHGEKNELKTVSCNAQSCRLNEASYCQRGCLLHSPEWRQVHNVVASLSCPIWSSPIINFSQTTHSHISPQVGPFPLLPRPSPHPPPPPDHSSRTTAPVPLVTQLKPQLLSRVLFTCPRSDWSVSTQDLQWIPPQLFSRCSCLPHATRAHNHSASSACTTLRYSFVQEPHKLIGFFGPRWIVLSHDGK